MITKNTQQIPLFTKVEANNLLATKENKCYTIAISRMTEEEYKYNKKNIYIQYVFAETLHGKIIIASTQKGICYLAFINDSVNTMEHFNKHFPYAKYTQEVDENQSNAISIFNNIKIDFEQIKLHIKGTDFQIKVWQILLTISKGKLSTYLDIASIIQMPGASRAVGTAVGSNPIAYIIPCHRVVQSNGGLGGYMWGIKLKAKLIAFDAITNGE